MTSKATKRKLAAILSADVKGYSVLMAGLKQADITLNRKMLSEIAIHDPAGFDAIVAAAKDALEKAGKQAA